LKGTVDRGLIQTFSRVADEIAGYSDADFAGDPGARRSTTGMVFKNGGARKMIGVRHIPSPSVEE
jgi:hypothetical protein